MHCFGLLLFPPLISVPIVSPDCNLMLHWFALTWLDANCTESNCSISDSWWEKSNKLGQTYSLVAPVKGTYNYVCSVGIFRSDFGAWAKSLIWRYFLRQLVLLFHCFLLQLFFTCTSNPNKCIGRRIISLACSKVHCSLKHFASNKQAWYFSYFRLISTPGKISLIASQVY